MVEIVLRLQNLKCGLLESLCVHLKMLFFCMWVWFFINGQIIKQIPVFNGRLVWTLDRVSQSYNGCITSFILKARHMKVETDIYGMFRPDTHWYNCLHAPGHCLVAHAGLEFHLWEERPFSFCKGHFHWKIFKSKGNFWRGTKAKTRATEGMSFVASLEF